MNLTHWKLRLLGIAYVQSDSCRCQITITYIVSHLGKGVGGAGPEHLASGGRLHVPDGDLVVAAHGGNEGGGVSRVSHQLVDVVHVVCRQGEWHISQSRNSPLS